MRKRADRGSVRVATGRLAGRLLPALAVALALGSLAQPLAAQSSGAAEALQPVSFVAMGDIPYLQWSEDGKTVVDDEQGRKLVREIIPAVKKAKPPFVVHYGDFKSGGASCTDTLFAERLAQIRALAPGRVIYTPGDNDWTDCDRDGLAPPMWELERLQALRRQAFRAEEMAAELKPVRQPLYPENARWMRDKILFASIHVVGTNNGRQQIEIGDLDMALAQVDARDAANAAWIDALFDQAMATEARAVVLVFQADIFAKRGEPCTALSRQACDGHAWLRDKLKAKATAFDKPVLAIHGDTDSHCLDRPLDGAPTFWRLNGPGDYWKAGPASGGIMEAARVTIDPASSRPVTVRYLLSGLAPPDRC